MKETTKKLKQCKYPIYIGPMMLEPQELKIILNCNSKKYRLVAVDGGANHLDQLNLTYDEHYGDGDSYKGELQDSLKKDKDFSDLAYTLKVQSDDFTKITLLGFCGGRLDHELFNIGECSNFLSKFENKQISLGINMHILSKGTWVFQSNDLFSIGTLNNINLNIEGDCKYKGTHRLSPLSSKGLSNCGSGLISIESDGSFFIFFPNDKKETLLTHSQLC